MKATALSNSDCQKPTASESCCRYRVGWRLLVAMAALLLPALGCRASTEPRASTGHGSNSDMVQVDPEVQERLGFELVVAQEAEITEPLSAPAVLQLDERYMSNVGSPVEGRLGKVEVRVADQVSAGQVLAWIYSPAWEAAQARLRTAAAAERSARAELDFAQQQYARAQRLWVAKAAARLEVDRARVELMKARNNLDAARAELVRARRELQQLAGGGVPPGSTLGLPLRAPIGGTVLERQASVGQAVVPGSVLFTVANLNRLRLLAEVEEQALGKLQQGHTVEFSVVAYPNERFYATIDYIGDQLDPKTRRVKVRCNVDNSGGRLRPEMFASVIVPGPAPSRVLSVPASAVQELHGVPVVFVPAGETRFRRQVVEVGRRGNGWVEIRSGLEPGQRVVGQGSFLLKSTLLLRAQSGAE